MNDIYVAPARAGTRPPQRGGANRSSRPRSPLQARAALLGGGALLALLCIYDLRCRSRRCDKGSLTNLLANNSYQKKRPQLTPCSSMAFEEKPLSIEAGQLKTGSFQRAAEQPCLPKEEARRWS